MFYINRTKLTKLSTATLVFIICTFISVLFLVNMSLNNHYALGMENDSEFLNYVKDQTNDSEYWAILRLNGGDVSCFKNTWTRTPSGDYVKKFKKGTSYEAIVKEWTGRLEPQYEATPSFFKMNATYKNIEPSSGSLNANTEFNVIWNPYISNENISLTACYKFEDDGRIDFPYYENYEWSGEAGDLCHEGCCVVFADNYDDGIGNPWAYHSHNWNPLSVGFCDKCNTTTNIMYYRYSVANLKWKRQQGSKATSSFYYSSYFINLNGASVTESPLQWKKQDDYRYSKKFIYGTNEDYIINEWSNAGLSKSGAGFDGWNKITTSSGEVEFSPKWNTSQYVKASINLNGGYTDRVPQGWIKNGTNYSKKFLKGTLTKDILKEWDSFNVLHKENNDYFDKWNNAENCYLEKDTEYTAQWGQFNFPALEEGEYYLSTYFGSNTFIEVANSSKSSGANVQLGKKDYSNNQKWQVKKLQNGNAVIYNKNSGLCLSLENDSGAANTNLVQKPFVGALSQQWIIQIGTAYDRRGILSALNENIMLGDNEKQYEPIGRNILAVDANLPKSQYFNYSTGILSADDSIAPKVEVDSIDNNQVSLKWTNIEGASEYSVWISENGSYYQIASQWQEENSYTVTGLQNNKEYYFAVRSIIKGKISPYYPCCIVKATPHSPVHVQSLTLNKSNIDMIKGETYKLIPTIFPSNADDKRVFWKSSNESVVTVDQNGMIKTQSLGFADITATTNDGGKKATCKVEVGNPFVVTINLDGGKASNPPLNWTAKADGTYTKDFAKNTPFVNIFKEWDNAELSKSGMAFVGWDPSTGILSLDTSFKAVWGLPVTLYRVYNPNSGEHFYTSSAGERDYLANVGWIYEGVAWKSPIKSNTPVYRLYNPNSGDHHYTTSGGERQQLINVGWRDEGTGWYSDDAKKVPVYRQYNPNAYCGSHNFTISKSENDWLVKLSWRAEGIAWYAIG